MGMRDAPGTGFRRRPPLPAVVGVPLARVYAAGVWWRNRRFDAGRGVIRFDRPVISVGNLCVGGTGKTPLVAHILAVLQRAGHRPCVAMRGYRGGQDGSDEACEYARRFPDVPVVARADRVAGLIELFDYCYDQDLPQPDCVVLDDGFQHRRIARDLDVVVVDATRNPFEDRLLPAGWLREPTASLRRAGFVVATHAECVPPDTLSRLDADVARVRGRGVQAVTRHAWCGLVVSTGGQEAEEPVGWLHGRRALVVCAIGNPGAFVRAAEQALGRPVAGAVVRRDHDPFRAWTMARVRRLVRTLGAEVILTTEKNWARLARAGNPGCPVIRPRLTLAFDRGQDALAQAVLETVAQGVPEPETGL